MAEQNKAARRRQFNVAELPTMRAVGRVLLTLTAAVHNWLIPIGTHPRIGIGMLALVSLSYSVVSWLAR
jgi:hypothetical protein